MGNPTTSGQFVENGAGGDAGQRLLDSIAFGAKIAVIGLASSQNIARYIAANIVNDDAGMNFFDLGGSLRHLGSLIIDRKPIFVISAENDVSQVLASTAIEAIFQPLPRRLALGKTLQDRNILTFAHVQNSIEINLWWVKRSVGVYAQKERLTISRQS